MNSEESFPIMSLPVEIKSFVFSYLDLKSTKSARLVCRNWKGIVDATTATFHATLNNRSALAVMNSDVTFDQLNIRNTTKFLRIRASASRINLPKAKLLSIDSGNSEATIFAFLKTTNSRQLAIRSEAFSWVSAFGLFRFLPGINWNSVTQLFVELEEPQYRNLNNIIQVLKRATLPNLSLFSFFAIHLELNCFGLRGDKRKELITEFLGFLNRHRRTLIRLSIHLFSSEDFELHPTTHELLTLLQTNLKIVDFTAGMGGSSNWPLICLPCVFKADRLISFRFSISDAKEPNNIQEFIEHVLEKNSPTLELLDISLNSLNLRSLRKCNRLESLRLSVQNLKTRIDVFGRSDLLNVKFLEISHNCFNSLFARLIGRNMKNLRQLNVVEWNGTDDEITAETIMDVILCPKLTEICFAWGIKFSAELEIRTLCIPGLSWRSALFTGCCLLIDRDEFNATTLQT